MTRCRVAIADDHPLVLRGIRYLLDKSPEFEIVGEFHSGRDVLRHIPNLRPELLLLDVRMGDQDGPEVARAILDRSSTTKIVIITAFDDPGVLKACLEAGVSGVLLKGTVDLDLLRALREVRAGGIIVDDTVTRALETAGALLAVSDGTASGIRPREIEVLRLMAMGLTTRDVAAELHLSVNTVRSYTQELMQKLGAHTRVQAIVQARRMQLI